MKTYITFFVLLLAILITRQNTFSQTNLPVHFNENDSIFISSTPPDSVELGKEYTYKIIVSSNSLGNNIGQLCNIYVTITDSLTITPGIDSTGTIKWSPDRIGNFNFKVLVTLKSDPNVFTKQEWTVIVYPNQQVSERLRINCVYPEKAFIEQPYQFTISKVEDISTKKQISLESLNVVLLSDTSTLEGVEVELFSHVVTAQPKWSFGQHLLQLLLTLKSDSTIKGSLSWVVYVTDSLPKDKTLKINCSYPDSAISGQTYQFRIKPVINASNQDTVPLNSLKLKFFIDNYLLLLEDYGLDTDGDDQIASAYLPCLEKGEHKMIVSGNLIEDSTIAGISEWNFYVEEDIASNGSLQLSVIHPKIAIPGQIYEIRISPVINKLTKTIVNFDSLEYRAIIVAKKTFEDYGLDTDGDDQIASFHVPEIEIGVYKFSFTTLLSSDTTIFGKLEWMVEVVDSIKEEKFTNFKGFVKGQLNKEPIPNARIEFLQFEDTNYLTTFSTSTDINGYYFLKLPQGFGYKIKATPPKDSSGNSGYKQLYYDGKDGTTNIIACVIVVSSEDDDWVYFYLPEISHNQNSLTGIVTDIGNISIPSKVILFSLRADGSNEKLVINDFTAELKPGDNQFKFSNLETGTYLIFAIPEDISYYSGYYKESSPVVIGWSDATKIEIGSSDNLGPYKLIVEKTETVSGNGSIVGQIEKDSMLIESKTENLQISKNISFVYLYAFDIENKLRKFVRSSNKGDYEIKDLAFEKYNVIADKIGYSQFSYEAEPSALNPEVWQNILLSSVTTIYVEDFNISNADKFKIFPNPTDDKVTIEYFADGISIPIIKIYNIRGELIKKLQLNNHNSGMNSIEIDTKELSAGVYFVVSQTENQISKTILIILKIKFSYYL